jgi:hypothetical protein
MRDVILIYIVISLACALTEIANLYDFVRAFDAPRGVLEIVSTWFNAFNAMTNRDELLARNKQSSQQQRFHLVRTARWTIKLERALSPFLPIYMHTPRAPCVPTGAETAILLFA